MILKFPLLHEKRKQNNFRLKTENATTPAKFSHPFTTIESTSTT